MEKQVNIASYLDSTYLKTAAESGISQIETKEIVINSINEAIEYLKKKTLTSQKNSITNIYSKRAVYYKFPIFLRALLLFLYRYIIKKGFLDGLNGIFYNLLQTLYYRLLVDLLITFHRISLIFKW